MNRRDFIPATKAPLFLLRPNLRRNKKKSTHSGLKKVSKTLAVKNLKR
jgi:hypothetical protein